MGVKVRPHLITNVCYGQPYSTIFLDFHLRSFLDPSNIPAVKDRMHYHVYSDEETAPIIGGHDNWKRLKDNCVSAEIGVFSWNNKEENRFQQRYSILIEMFKQSVSLALKKNAYLSAIVADLVCAKGFVPQIQKKMDDGHGAVFMLPPRSAYEAMAGHLAKEAGALSAEELFKHCYMNLHPLWLACQWDTINFTRLPFSMLWNSGRGLLARSFSITPIIFEPTVHMLNARQVIDVEIPSHCKNIYWCEDWTDAPVIGVEPLFCYYPPFEHGPSSVDKVGRWAQKVLHPSQFGHLSKSLYYPDKKTAEIPLEMQKKSDEAIEGINTQYGGFLV